MNQSTNTSDNSQKTIAILGSGWLGLPLARSLQEKNFKVHLSTRHEEKLAALKEQNFHSFIVDIDNESPQLSAFLHADLLIVNITSKSINGFSQLIEAINHSSIQAVLFVSSTSVYPFINRIVTEDDTNSEHPLAQIEKLFDDSAHFQTTSLRLAGTFGYERHPGRFFKSGKVVKKPDAPVNLIHRDDCINIIESIIAQEAWGETLNGVCDSHPSKRKFYSHAAKIANMPEPNFDTSESDASFKEVSNNYLKQRLGYRFIHSDLMEMDLRHVD